MVVRDLRLVLVASLGAAVACLDPAFECQTDAQCWDGSVAGVCERTGFCSHTDEECASGRRYVDAAPDHLADACVGEPLRPGPDPFDGGPASDDGGEGDDGGSEPDLDEPLPPREVDLLFVVDSSESALEQRLSVASESTPLVAQLVAQDLSVHVGIVTSDLGASGDSWGVNGCSELGDDGVLAPLDACGGEGRYLELGRGFDPTILECAIASQSSDCGVEQPLEAALRALSPINDGFLRPDSRLVIVFATEEEDCSVEDDAIFADDPTSSSTLKSRCAEGVGVWPVQRYVDGLLASRDRAQDLAMVSIVGVPGDLASANPIDFEGILTDSRMDYRFSLVGLWPVCTNASLAADPGRRFVGVGQGLAAAGATVRLRSVCSADASTWTSAILEAI